MSRSVLDLVRTTVAREIGVMRYYSERPPYKFCAMLDVEAREDVLKWCGSLRQALYTVEEKSLNDGWLRRYLRDLLWPKNVWTRETLVAIDETDGESLPQDMVTEVERLARGFNSSLIAEIGMKAMGEASHQHRAGVLSRQSRWHKLVSSDILADVDCKSLVAAPCSTAMKAAKIPKDLYEFGNRDFSLGNDKLDAISSD